MLIELTHFERSEDVFIDLNQITAIEPATFVTVAEAPLRGSHVHLRSGKTIGVVEPPQRCIQRIERRTGEILFAKEPAGSAPVDLQQRFERILEDLEKIENYLVANAIPNFLYEQVLASMRANLKLFDPR